MKRDATESNGQSTVNAQSHVATFAKVLDGRKNPIRGLWIRNDRYYGQLTFEDPNTGEKKVRRVPLMDKDGEPVATVAQAVATMERLRTKRTDNDLPNLKRTPKFSDAVTAYLNFLRSGKAVAEGEATEQQQDRMKKAGTIEKEDYTLAKWVKHLGDLRLDKIRRAHINSFIQKRKSEGVSNRTVNLDVISLRNVLRKGIDDGWIQSLPTVNMRPLKVTTPKRALFSHQDLEKLCRAAFEKKKNEQGKRVPITKNAQEFTDYLRFMAYTGARRNEALAVRKCDVDFDRDQVTIGATGDTKNSSARVVDFNPRLKALLTEMKKRWAPDSQWLFPSPQRGEKDIHAESFRESLELARTKAELPHIGFHDCRHLFISYCVMAGIDYMTIARWVGHRDGGILIGKVYGHLADAHVKAQAQKLNFEPVLVVATATAV